MRAMKLLMTAIVIAIVFATAFFTGMPMLVVWAFACMLVGAGLFALWNIKRV